MHIATISSKRQITLPKRLLDELGLEANRKVLVTKERGALNIKPMKKNIVDELGGSLRKYVHPSLLGKSFEEIKKEADDLYTKHLAKKYKLTR